MFTSEIRAKLYKNEKFNKKFDVRTVDLMTLYNNLLDFCRYYDMHYGSGTGDLAGDKHKDTVFIGGGEESEYDGLSLSSQLGKEGLIVARAKSKLVGINLASLFRKLYDDSDVIWEIIVRDSADWINSDRESGHAENWSHIENPYNYNITIIDYAEWVMDVEDRDYGSIYLNCIMGLDIKTGLDYVSVDKNKIRIWDRKKILKELNATPQDKLLSSSVLDKMRKHRKRCINSW